MDLESIRQERDQLYIEKQAQRSEMAALKLRLADADGENAMLQQRSSYINTMRSTMKAQKQKISTLELELRSVQQLLREARKHYRR